MNNDMLLPVIMIVALATILPRAIPFLLPKVMMARIIKYANQLSILPIILGVLSIYALGGTSLKISNDLCIRLVAALVVVISYMWKRNVLLSIGAGTALYMVLIQIIIN